MLEKLNAIKEKQVKLSAEIIKPEVVSDSKLYTKYIKEYNALEPIVKEYDEYSKYLKIQKDAQVLMTTEKDAELLELAQMEYDDSIIKLKELEDNLKLLLLPKDENDEKNVIVEIRSGAGGEEASLFSGVLYRMYCMYAESKRWHIEVLNISDTELGGIKEVSFIMKGSNVYSRMKYESGVHRVQRVPETESQGRIHTSTSTVAVLPEHEEVDIEILDKDLKIDTYRSTGAGGQHVNTTDSAVRITHLPTNIVVACQDERSQLKNKERAMGVLKSKLYDYYQMQLDTEYAKNRKDQVGTGDRSERIRTYNYPQGRLTDHRINYTVYNLDAFLNGDLDDLIDNLTMADNKAKLEKAD